MRVTKIFVYFFVCELNKIFRNLCICLLCIFVYFLCIVLRFKSLKWLRGPQLPEVIQWGSAEVKRLITTGIEHSFYPKDGRDTVLQNAVNHL
jgi:hypothetical protein